MSLNSARIKIVFRSRILPDGTYKIMSCVVRFPVGQNVFTFLDF